MPNAGVNDLLQSNPSMAGALDKSIAPILQSANTLDASKIPTQNKTIADNEVQQLQANYGRNQTWTKPGAQNFNTPLTPTEEQQFQQWLATNKVPFDPNQPVQDYDMRGFWKALMSGDPKAQSAVDPNDKRLHYPDYWKTPYHQTFSNESQWADPKKAPHWNEKDQLVMPDGTVIFDDRAQKGKQ